MALGPLAIPELFVALPRVKFPVDVSGGVARFCHRRGELVRMSLELPHRRLERLLKQKLRGLLGTSAPAVWVGLAAEGAAIAVSDPDGPTLAFDVLCAVSGDGVRLVIEEARGIGLPRPALALAMVAMTSLLDGHASREGATFVVREIPSRIARRLLPEAGVRVPSSEGMTLTSVAGASDAWVVQFTRGGVPAAPTARVALALETATLLSEADDQTLHDAAQEARETALRILSRAPRHVATVVRLADLDRAAGDRAETALATLETALGDEDVARSLLRAALSSQRGDARGAEEAFRFAAEAESVPLLAARAFEAAARQAQQPERAVVLLDMAIARYPSCTSARLLRLEHRLALGRVDDAFADAEELEAQAASPRARYEVWKRCADVFLAAGLRSRAARLYERALRFLPNDAMAVAGLGRALVAQGSAPRGVRLLVRALELLGEAPSRERDAVILDLATALSAALGDAPAAIARLESVEDASPIAFEARALEAKLRADIGDLPGASFAWARLRSAFERIRGADDLEPQKASLAAHLASAARFELEVHGDARSAQRHAQAAIGLAPRDAAIGELFRKCSEGVATLEGAVLPARATPEPSAPLLASPGAPAPAAHQAPAHAPSPVEVDEGALDARAAELTSRLQGDPTNDAIADELLDLLMRLGRPHEVFALISARVDDASPERRPALRARQRAVVTDLARDARARGNDAEAALFESFANVSDD